MTKKQTNAYLYEYRDHKKQWKQSQRIPRQVLVNKAQKITFKPKIKLGKETCCHKLITKKLIKTRKKLFQHNQRLFCKKKIQNNFEKLNFLC